MNDELSRRNLLKMTAGAVTALTGSNWVFRVADGGRIVKAQTDAVSAWKPVYFKGDEADQVAALCEAIIPRTHARRLRARPPRSRRRPHP